MIFRRCLQESNICKGVGLVKKRGVVFEGGGRGGVDTLMHTMTDIKYSSC